MRRAIKDVKQFMHEMGGLHDAVIESFEVVFGQRRTIIVFKDVCSNFEGMPEDRGPCHAVIGYEDTKDVTVGVGIVPGLRVYDAEVRVGATPNDDVVTLLISPGGRISIECGAVWLESDTVDRLPRMVLALLETTDID